MDAGESLLNLVKTLDEEVYMSGPTTEWISGALMFCQLCLSYIQLFGSDFTHRLLSVPESDGDATTPHATLTPSSTPFLREWAKAKLTRHVWGDALLSAVSVSISFCSPLVVGLTHCWFLVQTAQGHDLQGRM